MLNNHTLIDLSIIKNKIYNYIEIIKSIFHERFVFSEISEDDNSNKIIKKIKNCNYIDKYEIKNEIK